MDYNSIIENTKKYHYFIKSSVRIIHLSEAKIEALKKLEPTIDNLIGKKIIFLKIISTNNKDSFFKSKDGPISLIIEPAIIKNNNKIKDLIEGGNNTIYLSHKYIKKNKDNLIKNFKKIINDFYIERLNKIL